VKACTKRFRGNVPDMIAGITGAAAGLLEYSRAANNAKPG
jgi:hypothetical protein